MRGEKYYFHMEGSMGGEFACMGDGIAMNIEAGIPTDGEVPDGTGQKGQTGRDQVEARGARH